MTPSEWAKVCDALTRIAPVSPIGRDLRNVAQQAAVAFRRIDTDRVEMREAAREKFREAREAFRRHREKAREHADGRDVA